MTSHSARPRAARSAVAPLALACALACMPAIARATAAPEKPNIVFILADDLGYGDLACYGAVKVKTPNVDRLAREGILFTDAHAPAAVCTPTRYALLTGREFWRRTKKWEGEYLLHESPVTLPGVLKSAGYATGCIGKWHVGFCDGPPDWNGELKPGPLEAGFDVFFGNPRTHNEPPQVLVEGHRVLGLDPADPIHVLPPDRKNPHGVLKGGASAMLNHEELATRLTGEALKFIRGRAAGAAQGTPFFLYFASSDVHVPITPHQRFRGTSGCGLYGDFIHEFDWSVGEVLGELDRLGLATNTLVVLTSDNGAMVPRDAFRAGHRPNAALLGQKCDAWEGGHRVPFLARWPSRIPAGARSADLLSLSDTIATFAALTGAALPAGAAPDSRNQLAALRNEPGRAPARTEMTIVSTRGLALRDGRWMFYPRQGSGGYTADPDDRIWMKLNELGQTNSDYTADGKLRPGAPPGQLYDLEADPGETTNLYTNRPDIAARMDARLTTIQKEGRGH